MPFANRHHHPVRQAAMAALHDPIAGRDRAADFDAAGVMDPGLDHPALDPIAGAQRCR